jgi:hypothetical protein
MAAEILALIFLIMLIAVVFILLTVFWIWMIVDCAKRDFKKENEKVVWILIIVLVGVIGSIIYYFIVKAKDKK